MPRAKAVPENAFRAVTWNVYNGTEASVLDPIMKAQHAKGVSLYLMQEAGGGDLDRMCAANGLETYLGDPQYRVAWDPEVWTSVAERTVRLSTQHYFRKGKTDPQTTSAAEVILCDRRGRSLTALSYHTPAHVQVSEEERTKRRYDVMLESFRTLGTLADEAVSIGWLAGGDDNWDEDTGIQTDEVVAILLGEAVGLRQVASPPGTSTHGKRRQIDDFRIRRAANLKVGDGWVTPGGGDHKLHGREFLWKGSWR